VGSDGCVNEAAWKMLLWPNLWVAGQVTGPIRQNRGAWKKTHPKLTHQPNLISVAATHQSPESHSFKSSEPPKNLGYQRMLALANKATWRPHLHSLILLKNNGLLEFNYRRSR